MSLRQSLRRSALYYPWRKLREAQQVGRFARLLDESLRDADSPSAYSEALVSERLNRIARGRRPIRGRNGASVAVGFGAEDWEHLGLWPSFGRVSGFRLFNYSTWLQGAGARANSAESRRAVGEAFTAFVRDVDRECRVGLVFIYADSKFISPGMLESLREMGIWTVLMGLDDKHRFAERQAFGMTIGQATVARQVDLTWTTWKAGVDAYLKLGALPWYAPEAADPEFFHPGAQARDIEVLFVGQAYGYRLDLVRFLRERGFQVETYGSGWPNGFASEEALVGLFGRSRVVLGVGGVQSMEGVKHLKGRDFEVPMCGALYLTTYNYELADHFDIGKEILCYGSREECAEILHWILRRPEEAERIRRRVLERSLRCHTWEGRIRALLGLWS